MGCFFGYLKYLSGGEKGLEKKSWLKDSAGKNIHMGMFWSKEKKTWIKAPLEQDILAGTALYPILRDWDNDGDLDLIIGSRSGTIGLRINEGDKTNAVFSDKNIYLQANGKPIILLNQVSIDFVDLDNDKLPDLVCAEHSGIVKWYKNQGTKKQPKFTTPEIIFDLSLYKKEKKLKAEESKHLPVKYLALAVRDLNGDQKPDILIGAKGIDHKPGYWIIYQK
jgi:hypothetical protein